MFFVPARFIFWGRLSFFIIWLLLEKLERTKPTGVTVNTNYSAILRYMRYSVS